MEYEEEGNVNIDHVRKLEIFGPFEVENRIFFASDYTFTASSEDKFTGILRNIPFQLEELKVEKVTGSGKRERREIMLQSYQIELDTELHPDCTILAFCENAVNTVAVDFIRLHNVFPKGGEPSGWNVFSDNPKNCLDYMQHSAMVNVLKKVADIGRESLQEEDLVLYIVGGKIRLFIPSRKDRFESAIIGWTSSSKIHKFYTELEGMVKMVDVLASWYINA